MPFDVDVEVTNGNRVIKKGSYRNLCLHGTDTISALVVEVFNYLSGVDKDGEV
jgi:hypothetical protein